MAKSRNNYIFSKKCLLIILYLFYINNVNYNDIIFRSFGFHFPPSCNYKIIVNSLKNHTHKYAVRIFHSLKEADIEDLDVMGNINVLKVPNIHKIAKIYSPKQAINIYFDEVKFISEGFIEGKFFKYELDETSDSLFKDDLLHYLSNDSKKYRSKDDDSFLLWLLKLYTSRLSTDLVLGAGINCDYGAKDWKSLITTLNSDFYKNNNRALNETKHYVGEELFVSSKVLTTNGFDVYKSLNTELYLFKEAKSFNDQDSTLYRCVDYIARHQGTNVITYNYDTNLEYLLRKRNLLYSTVYDENSFLIKGSYCNIFHVHGLLPYNKYNESRYTDSLIFSESEYFYLYNNPYTWNISKQLHDFTFNTCIFIGISLTDPNMKRLLELSKNPLKFNFIFLKKEKDYLDSTFKDLTNYYFTYDLIPLWIDDYPDISKWLDCI